MHLNYDNVYFFIFLRIVCCLFAGRPTLAVNMALEPDSFGLEFKDVDAASIDTLTIGIENIDQDCDVSDLVQSIYDDKIQLFPSKLFIALMKLREVKNQ